MSATSFSLTATSRRRLSRARISNRVFTSFLWATGVLALLPLAFIVGYVVRKGLGILSLHFFTHTPAIVAWPLG